MTFDNGRAAWMTTRRGAVVNAMKKMDRCSISEAAFIMFAASRGWECAVPVHHANGYDFVVNDGEGWRTVQVKSAFTGKAGTKKNPCRTVSLRRCNEKGTRAYADGDFDLLYVYDSRDAAWLIPWRNVSHIKSQIVVSINGDPSNKWVKYLV
jgi:hypothetical protein